MRTARIVADLANVRPGKSASPNPIQAKAPQKRWRGSRLGSAVIWGGVGFLTGAVFWHAVGFWTFLSDVVLEGAPKAKTELTRVQAPRATPAQTATKRKPPALPTFFMVDPANCTALALDRRSNRTARRPCPERGLALRLDPQSGREDLAVLTQPRIQAAGYRTD